MKQTIIHIGRVDDIGKLQITPKKLIKKALGGKSPDFLDCLIMAEEIEESTTNMTSIFIDVGLKKQEEYGYQDWQKLDKGLQ